MLDREGVDIEAKRKIVFKVELEVCKAADKQYSNTTGAIIKKPPNCKTAVAIRAINNWPLLSIMVSFLKI
ncbi:hypothetical protein [Mucilaginibacter gilvus]|uniref:Uncharacterized protein n=1 Tax=Mucilaginibacter gilvus TaxID=2305909 RepID=A0A444MN67_9SPHI|nr:hypothetical protein [Mucilaginibacter gilvus]RWY51139.1 hypothetical protein EPL05_13820 [Mucilaginibacter gilvus]